VILLCTGGRSYADRARVFAELDKVHAETPIVVLMHGAARGADTLASLWWHDRQEARLAAMSGLAQAAYPFIEARRPANWSRDGKAAGPIRNAAMVREVCGMRAPGRRALCLAFPGGSGTADCIRRARAAGIEVRIVESDK
jgi:hypothetical protein